MIEFIETLINSRWLDFLDIIIVAVLIYQVLLIIRGTRAFQILLGLFLIFIAYQFSLLLGFYTLHWILNGFLSSIVLIVIVLFQNEFRRALAKFGKTSFTINTAEELNSLDKMDSWAGDNVTLTLSGHNEPIENLHDRIKQIKGIHAKRLARTLEILSDPRTIAEVSSQLFGDVGGYDILLSVEEAGAHVEYLYQRGLLGISNIEEIEQGSVPLLYERINDTVAAQVRICC